MRRRVISTITGCVCASWAGAAQAQDRLDQADPTIAARTLPDASPVEKPTAEIVAVPAPAPAVTVSAVVPERRATAIVVDGALDTPAAAFGTAVLPFIGRNLDDKELAQLAAAVAEVARRRGYLFATASIPAQDLADGVLHVRIDEGKIDAVRVIGARNATADRILTARLANGRPTTLRKLERTIQLIDDLPGVDVEETSFRRQDGFGILLVTISQDRASAYLQTDNRGTKEVGPIRSTFIGNLRNVFRSGDELGIIASSTPLQASEFAFARARYSTIVDRFGSVVSLTTGYGRVQPGASLDQLGVLGHSLDVSVSYSRVLERSRSRGLWASAEFRALRTDQRVLGIKLRDDRLATLTTSLNGFYPLGGGTMRGEIGVAVGLPIAGVTHQGEARASRPDGDARFVTLGYSAEWSRKLNSWVAVSLSSSGQLASRPLLATAEIGVGGSGFARAYDSAERTGDQGVLGAAELRFDLRKLAPRGVNRMQAYSFVDGGHVSNLRGGAGGGSLLSAGAGLRFGVGRFDGTIEAALPLNADRFDTGDRRPRYSFRLARSF